MNTQSTRHLVIALSGIFVLALTQHAAAKGPTGPVVLTNGGYLQTQIASGKATVLPLKHTDVQADIAGTVSSVRVTQVFVNPSDKPIEAVYVFPLPHRADRVCVCGG